MESQNLLLDQEMGGDASPLPDPQARRGRVMAALGSMAVLAVVGVVGSTGHVPHAGLVQHSGSPTDHVVVLAEEDGDDDDDDDDDDADDADDAAEADDADDEDEAEEAAKDAAAKKKAEAEAKTKAKEEAAALKAAAKLTDQANNFKTKSDHLKSNAQDLEKKEKGLEDVVAKTKKEASQNREDAEKARAHAEELQKKAADMLKQSKEEDAKAGSLDKDASKQDGVTKLTQQQADDLSKKADAAEKNAMDTLTEAMDAESQALQSTADQRMCIGLPGVMLRGAGPTDFGRVVGNVTISDDVQCNDWCLKHNECQQSVFSWDTKTCELFTEALAEPIYFRESWPWYNSSFCSLVHKKDDMLAKLHKVYDQKPWVPEAHNCSWGSDNCIHTKCCADSCKANWDWSKCEYFTCWQKDEFFAGCSVGAADANWDGTRLGGHDNGEIGPVDDGKLIQGTRLYCFTVVMWNQAPKEGWMNSEAELANHWKDKELGIMQCDDYSMFDGLEGGSEHNIQSFIQAWKKVKDDGRYKNNDWTIKVDADAVFLPDHFRKKVQWIYKTPQGAALYMRNTHYKFMFLGALEVLTREGTEVFLERSWECEAKLGQQGGEDYWLQQCLEGLGLNFQTDTTLLHDKYAEDENCADPNGVAHHFFKKIDAWDVCWGLSNDAWNNAHPE